MAERGPRGGGPRPERRQRNTDEDPVLSAAEVQEIIADNKNFPVYLARADIEQKIAKNDRIIVVGQTGSGKSTLLPEFFLGVLAKTDPSAKIVVTQPRRIAARRLAKRIGIWLGKENVGYKYKGANTVDQNTKVACTVDGSLLAELKTDPLLMEYSGVMVDEVHERSIDIDIELALLKQAQAERKRQGLKLLKLLITSATLDQEQLVKYFDAPPPIDVEGRLYKVEPHFATREIERVDLMAAAAQVAKQVVDDPTKKGDILIFMPGKQEIDKTITELQGLIRDPNVEIIPLAGDQDAAEQDRIFVKDGKRKIIVATNVAETSITIDTVRTVIDSGLARMTLYDPNTGLSSLQTVEHARSNYEQRKGRAGRKQEGDAYLLYTPDQLKAREDFARPEIQRTDLLALVLRLKKMGREDVHGFDFIDHPGKESLDLAVDALQKLGALDETGKITTIGEEMAELPYDPHFSRMLVEAKKKGKECVEAVSVLVGFLSSRRSVFAHDPRKTIFSLKYSDYLVPESDLLTMVNVWNASLKHSGEESRKWAAREGFNRSALFDVTQEKNDIIGEEYFRGLHLDRTNKPADLKDKELTDALSACITVGLADRVLIKNAGGSYDLADGRKSGIGVDRNSGVARNNPDMMVAGSIRFVESQRKTFAGLNHTITPELLTEVAPYLEKLPKHAVTKPSEEEQPKPQDEQPKPESKTPEQKKAEEEKAKKEAEEKARKKKEEQQKPGEQKPTPETETLESNVPTEQEEEKKPTTWFGKLKAKFKKFDDTLNTKFDSILKNVKKETKEVLWGPSKTQKMEKRFVERMRRWQNERPRGNFGERNARRKVVDAIERDITLRNKGKLESEHLQKEMLEKTQNSRSKIEKLLGEIAGNEIDKKIELEKTDSVTKEGFVLRIRRDSEQNVVIEEISKNNEGVESIISKAKIKKDGRTELTLQSRGPRYTERNAEIGLLGNALYPTAATEVFNQLVASIK